MIHVSYSCWIDIKAIFHSHIVKIKSVVQSVPKESQMTGVVGAKTYISYFKSVRSCAIIFVVAVLFIASQASMSGIDYFITRWSVAAGIIDEHFPPLLTLVIH